MESPMDQSTDIVKEESKSKPLHKCPKCDRTFGNIGHMKCHFYRVHPEFKLAEFEVPEATKTVPKEKPEVPKQKIEKQQPDQQKREPKQPEVKPAPPVAVPLNKIQQMLSKCGICNRCFTNKTSLLKHRASVHADRSSFACGTCDKSFPTAARLRSHEEVHNKVRGPCLECAKSPSRGRCNHKKKRYVCKVCQRVFLYRSRLRKHLLTHDEDDFQCDECDKTFELRSDLEKHLRSHSRTTEIQCERSTDVPALNPRGRLVLGKELPKEEQKDSLTCDICDKTFGRRCNLVRHIAMHKLDEDRS